MSNNKIETKILFIGDSFVGKSTLFICLTKGVGMTQPKSTISTQNSYREFNLEGKDIKVKIYDPPGQERYFGCVKQFLRVQGIVLVYDVTNNESFSYIQKVYPDIVEAIGNQSEFIIIGNKCDLKNKLIQENQVQEFANNIGCDYYETTATDPSTIEFAFTKLIEKIVNKQPEIGPPPITLVSPKKQNKCDCF
ncbi:hypothetical protein ACTFIW_005056 [Dictyostelium discoideum]